MTSIFIKNYAIFYSSNLNRWYTKFSSLLLQLLWHESSEDCLFNQTIQVSKYYEKKKKTIMLKEKHLLTFSIFPLQMSNSFCISAKDVSSAGKVMGWQWKNQVLTELYIWKTVVNVHLL